jgi:hypothetical protein
MIESSLICYQEWMGCDTAEKTKNTAYYGPSIHSNYNHAKHHKGSHPSLLSPMPSTHYPNHIISGEKIFIAIFILDAF